MPPIRVAALALTLAGTVAVGTAPRPPLTVAGLAAPTTQAGPAPTVPPAPSRSPARVSAGQPAGGPVYPAPSSTSVSPPDWSQFWPTIIATFLGAGLGLGGALYVERRLARKRRDEQARQRLEDHAFALELLADELSRNIAVLRGILDDLEAGMVTDRSPARDVWRSLSTDALAAIKRPSTAAAVLLAYTRLGRIEQRTRLYHEEVRGGGPALSRALKHTLPPLRALVEEGLGELDQAGRGVRTELTRLTTVTGGGPI
jgi:hypothetical protein